MKDSDNAVLNSSNNDTYKLEFLNDNLRHQDFNTDNEILELIQIYVDTLIDEPS